MPGGLNRRDFLKEMLLASAAGSALLFEGGCLGRLRTRRAPAALGPQAARWINHPAALREARAALHQSIDACVRRGDVPGAVGLVQVGGFTLFHEAFGSALITPGPPIPMRPDHRFDLASLTKVVATTTCILSLRDRGRLDLGDPLARHLPQLAGTNKQNITLHQCLTHTAGLPPFRLYFKQGLRGKDDYLRAIAVESLDAPPGTRWNYSDLGFILLGFVAEAAGGQPLDAYARDHIFSPLGMAHTGYRPIREGRRQAPPRKLAAEFAATELCPWRKRLMVGQVHDENAYALGGVSGHAGLFSTADDLARFGQMLLDRGQAGAVRILSSGAVGLLNEPQVPAANPLQCLGWRLRASLESTLGFLASPRSFGHTGFTGTSLWIDPDNQVLAVLLTNAVHPSRAKAHASRVRLAFHGATVREMNKK